jgi:cyclohexanone monooxygenase
MSNDDVIDIDVEALRRKYAEERAKRLQTQESNREPEPNLTGKFANFDRDVYADPNFTRAAIKEETDVVIIGGGIAGLLAGARLYEKGIKKIRIIEKGADFGGTWYWNRYPGAACDVESYSYLPMLEETGFMPSERYPKANEIYAYLKSIAERYELYPAALFQTLVSALKWDEKRSRWNVRTSRGDEFDARFVISCTGPLSAPKLPKIPGIETFKGHTFHTARWDYKYTGGDQNGGMTGLNDKVVGIIGTGCTAVQALPPLAEASKHLYLFQRTPSFVDERGNRPTDPVWFKSQKPGWQAERQHNFASQLSGAHEPVDLIQDGWTDIVKRMPIPIADNTNPPDPVEMEKAGLRVAERNRRRVERLVKDKATAEALKPYYHYFCKRPTFHDEFFDAFNRPNVTLVDTEGRGVERITPNGLVVKGKEYPVDCLIHATGFDYLKDYAVESGFDAVGPGGLKLSQHWKEGPRTLMAIQTDKFPNFFFVRLPQAGISPNYTHMATEQTFTIAYLIDQCMKQGKATVEAKTAAVDAWVNDVVAMSAPHRAFLETCTPGQYNFEGDPAKERLGQLNELYAGGPIKYLGMLREIRATNDLKNQTFS